jgi:hypothetical protein
MGNIIKYHFLIKIKMKKIFSIIIITSTFIIACRKENKVAIAMKGKWNITEIRLNKDSVITDFTPYKHTIEFYESDNAYTATLRAVYSIDYLDTVKKDIIDSTLRYEIKGNQISFAMPNNVAIRKFIWYRARIDEYKGDNLFLNRTPIDTTEGHLKAVRLK